MCWAGKEAREVSSVHVSGDGFKMPLRQVRQFVEYTKDWPADTWVDAGVIGMGLRTEYSTLQGLRAERKNERSGG